LVTVFLAGCGSSGNTASNAGAASDAGGTTSPSTTAPINTGGERGGGVNTITYSGDENGTVTFQGMACGTPPNGSGRAGLMGGGPSNNAVLEFQVATGKGGEVLLIFDSGMYLASTNLSLDSGKSLTLDHVNLATRDGGKHLLVNGTLHCTTTMPGSSG
jgi:hypothetical protein